MGANTGSNGVKTNYYSITNGMLSENRKQILKGFEQIDAKSIKEAQSEFYSIDLRMKYVDRGDKTDYRFKHYFTGIDGAITDIKVEETSFGKVLKLILRDSDDEISSVSSKFYGKYSEDLLNRLCNVDFTKVVSLKPYSIPDEFITESGETFRFFSQGVSIYNPEKVERAFNKESGLPDSERVDDPSGGGKVTSRIKRINWLWEKLQEKLSNGIPEVVDFNPTANTISTSQTSEVDDTEDIKAQYTQAVESDFEDDLPF